MVNSAAFSSQNPPRKGIIVCDTNALYELMSALPRDYIRGEALKENPELRTPVLFDFMKLLAAHGYEIIIPSAVAYEMGGHLQDGQHLGIYIPDSETPTGHLQARKSLSERPFFAEIAHLEAQGLPIHIAPPLSGDSSSEAHFLNELDALHKTPTSENFSAEIKAARIKSWLKHFAPEPRTHFADKQIKQYVAEGCDAHTPVFVLTNDRDIQASFSSMPHVSALGSTGFIKAMYDADLFNCIGLKNIMFQSLGYTLNEAAHARGSERQFFSKILQFDGKSSDDLRAVGHTHPFAEAIASLAPEIPKPRLNKNERYARSRHQGGRPDTCLDNPTREGTLETSGIVLGN